MLVFANFVFYITSEYLNYQQTKSFWRSHLFFEVTDDTKLVHLPFPFTLTSAFPQHFIQICCIDRERMPRNDHFCWFLWCCSNTSISLPISHSSSPSFSDCLQCYWSAHFISLPNIQFHGGMRKCCRATYGDLTTVQCARFAAASPLSFNKQCSCLLALGFPPCLDKQLNGVTVNRGVSVALL